MKLLRTLGLAACILFPAAALPKDRPPPLDGPGVQFRDKLVDRLAGRWELKGKVAGQAARYSVTAGWVLNHQFMRIHQKELRSPGKEAPYEAIVFVGRDNTSERYVAHWIDGFGGRASETLGFGKRKGSAITFVFEYPDGPFHTTFRWNPKTGGWHWLMRTKNKAGQWTTFGEGTLRRLANPK
jgi:hypothetical protein